MAQFQVEAQAAATRRSPTLSRSHDRGRCSRAGAKHP
eukprot:CAMPEP_0118938542 /NCGR_PEP_ID=MMETSP1169-20130426/26276_1 /TAXON_ID=36882 /ORGANISM="Pyramimonas obovata, Strain CCMP722" /LENGTH=36 /DNA_ID= /DNA_START= /DNA_END= /DNA_ORIENTATION=